MGYKKVTFASVEQEIGKIFNNHDNEQHFNLTPDSIHTFAKHSGVILKWLPILNWNNCFEFHTYEYTDKEFLEIIFANANHLNGPTIIITDECFKEKMAFSVSNFNDMVDFMENIYPTLFSMEFAQPCDFIFIQPLIGLIIMIHHEGIRAEYCRS
jgi:hypothetical protein